MNDINDMNDITVTFANGGGALTCPFGTPFSAFAPRLAPAEGGLAAVKANNEILPLSARLEIDSALEPVALFSPEGVMIYRRSLAYLLAIASKDLFPDRRLYVGHSLGNTYYYTFADGKAPSAEDARSLKDKMGGLAAQDLPINYRYMAYAQALALFERNSQTDTKLLLDERGGSAVKVNQCGGFTDLYVQPLVPRTGFLKVFDVAAYQDGLLLCFPGAGGMHKMEPFEDSPKIFAVYNEHKKWSRDQGVQAAGHLNRLVRERAVKAYIQVAEAFQSKTIGHIADKISERQGALKVVLIAGPSSSGKTTTAKRLSIELKVMGIEPIAVSLDNYYVNSDKTPRDEKGEPDYECLSALDVPYFNQQLASLFKGREATLPVYDFKTGRRREGGKTIRLGSRSMLIVEGIHGLNDALIQDIPKESAFKLYVSALTQLNLDDHNRIPTTDNRLLRRLVRDYQFRAVGAAETIKMWPSVQRGEWKYIFPFQNGADFAFNSALSYELAVLKFYADPILRSVKPGSAEYAEAARLSSFLENFAPIPPQYVPGQSILREFIGESEFKY
ncbi:MAG: nucleoside kinase [Spirochaetaceae bacterium]|jgi:uridine kinase|nr:nucleoside kinase [Spirochaetaceae bacterium]